MSVQTGRITVSRAPDAIDEAAGLTPDDAIFDLRAARPDYVEGAETCRTATLLPREDLGLPPELRTAIARRVALRSGSMALAAQYPCPAEPELSWPRAATHPTGFSRRSPHMPT